MRLAKAFAEVDTESREPAETTIKSFMPIGSIEGTGFVSVSAFELVIPAQELLFHGVRFELDSGDEYTSPSVVTVALRNAEKLVASLDELAGYKITTERFAMTEVEAVVDELRIVVFNSETGQLHAAVETSGTICHLRRQSELFDLSKLVSLSIEHLRTQGAQYS